MFPKQRFERSTPHFLRDIFQVYSLQVSDSCPVFLTATKGLIIYGDETIRNVVRSSVASSPQSQALSFSTGATHSHTGSRGTNVYIWEGRG